jgi:amidase
MSELWRLTATEAVARLRRGEVSPLEMVEAAAQRIEAVEPKVNALPIRFLDEARDQARRFRRESHDHPGWLAGLPIAVKDYNDVAGQLTTNGSPIYAKNRAAADDRTVATLRANGAIPLAKSNVPEFAGSHTFNPVWGVYCRRVVRWRGGRARGRGGVAGEWLLPRRLAAHPGQLLRRRRPAAEPRRGAARRRVAGLRQSVGGGADGAQPGRPGPDAGCHGSADAA